MSNSNDKENFQTRVPRSTSACEVSSQVEQSFIDAGNKILKLRLLESENKISLLNIENEKLNMFLFDQNQQTARLTQELEMVNLQNSEMQSKYEERINSFCYEINRLESQNKKLEDKIVTIRNEQQSQQDELKNCILDYQNQLKYEKQIYENWKQREKENYEKQLNNCKQVNQDLEKQNLELTKRNNFVEFDSQAKSNEILQLTETITDLEQKISNLEARLDIMIDENSKLSSMIEESYNENELLKKKFQDQEEQFHIDIETLNNNHEQQMLFLNTKMNEIKSEEVKDLQKQLTYHHNQIEVKEKEIITIKQVQTKVLDQLNTQNNQLKQEIQNVYESMERLTNEQTQILAEKENQIVKLSKQLFSKEQAFKQKEKNLKEKESIFKQQEDQKLLDQIRENKNLILELQSRLEQITFLHQKYQLLEENYSELQQKSSEFEKQQQAHKELEKEHLRILDRNKHQESLIIQLKKEFNAANKQVQDNQNIISNQTKKIKELETEINQQEQTLLINRQSLIQIEQEIQLQEQNQSLFISQHDDSNKQKEKLLTLNENLQQENEKLENQLSNALKDKQILENSLDMIKKQKSTSEGLVEELQRNIQDQNEEINFQKEECERFKQIIDQLELQIKQIQISCFENYSQKEIELKNEYENLVKTLSDQASSITEKYNQLVKKERDNRFRLKLYQKSNSAGKLPGNATELLDLSNKKLGPCKKSFFEGTETQKIQREIADMSNSQIGTSRMPLQNISNIRSTNRIREPVKVMPLLQLNDI